MISLPQFDTVVERLRDLGFADDDIRYSEECGPPESAEDFASEAIYVICNSGMKNTIAVVIYRRCMEALFKNAPVSEAFGHAGKACAIETIWRERQRLYNGYMAVPDDLKLDYLEALPWIGSITKYHLAKNFGIDCVKPDVHLARLAKIHQTTPDALCAGLSAATGYRKATIDLLIWRACANGVIDSRTGRLEGRATTAPDEGNK